MKQSAKKHQVNTFKSLLCNPQTGGDAYISMLILAVFRFMNIAPPDEVQADFSVEIARFAQKHNTSLPAFTIDEIGPFLDSVSTTAWNNADVAHRIASLATFIVIVKEDSGLDFNNFSDE